MTHRTVIVSLAVAPAGLLCALTTLVGCSACSGAQDPVAAAGSPSVSTAGASGAGGTANGAAGSSSAAGGALGGSTTTGGAAGASAGSGGSAAGSGGTAGSGGATGSSGAAGSAGSAPIDHDAPGVIVVLGSSTAAGTGPKLPENTWVERYRAYLKVQFPHFTLTNLAVGGYTTYQMQPSDYPPPGTRPLPDKAHNITAALALKPNAIIINMPTNDTNANYPAADQMANFDRVTKLAAQNGASCWVTTSQPRNFTGDSDAVKQTKHALLMTVRDAIKQKYGDHTLDFWTQFADANGNIKDQYGAGDGTHMSDEAHAVLVQIVIDAKIPEAVLARRP